MPRPTRWPHLLKVHVTRAQADALKAHAIREGVPVADIARRAIATEIAQLNTAKH